MGLDFLYSESDVVDAESRIKILVPKTNLTRSYNLSCLINGNVYLKEEHRQITNSFKLRGAANSLLLNKHIFLEM